MNLKKKYGNYELHPQMKITGYENEIWDEKKEIIEELKRAVQEKQKEKKTCILSFDLYPGVRKEEIMELANALQPDRIFDIEDCAKDEETLLREFNDYITDDRVFGIMCHKTIDTWFESEKLETMKKAIETERAEEKDTNGGLIVIVGTAAELLTEADLLVYCDLTRWEVQLRYRSGMPNWHSTNYNDPILTKYKRGFFIEWRLADRYKKERYEKFTYLLDTETENAPVLTTGNAFRGALQQLAGQPFRMEPYFDPGVWGGQWMKENFGLDASKENFAWSFDGVPEENSLNLEIGGKTLKVPAQDLVLYAPHELLGERVHGRFGAEFPIRFDLLDTMGGQNLSLQVHPLTEYIYEKFGMPYTQDESYYLLDADEDEETYVYLGLKEGVDKKEMERELRAAEKGEERFPVEKYVNKIPVKKHDHVLIPAGTVHCSGKNTMVLEISATPYIFTFKLWDWGRLGMVFSVGLAIMISLLHNKRASKVYQTMMFFPYFMSWVVASYFLDAFLNQDNGLINSIMRNAGKEPIQWYMSAGVWPFILIFMYLWKSTGYNMVIYLSSISGIDTTLYEAAVMDGANKRQQVWHITLPCLKSVIIMMFILNVGKVFYSDFGLFFQLSQGASGSIFKTTATIDTYVYNALQSSTPIGMTSAATFFQSVACCITILLANAIVKKIDEDSAII